jgi:TonB family protein
LNLSEALEAWISKHFKSSLPISTYDDKKPIVKKLRADTSISMSPLDTNLYRFFTIRGNRLIEKRLRVSDSSLVDSINYLRVSFKKKKKKVEKVISSFSYYSNGKLQVKQFYNTSLERIYKVRSERLDSLFSYYENGLLKRQEFSDSKNKSKTTCYKLDGSKIEFTPFQILASFPGGEDAMMRWLGMNIKYPKSAFEAGIAGIVYSNFFVNKEGYLTDIKISRGVSEDIDDEVLRVIKAMPRWSPAILDDKKVISYFTLPIEFGEPE